MLPRVILHTAVSADGRMDWFTPNVGLFYRLVSPWEVSVLLAPSLVGGTTPRSFFRAPDLESPEGVVPLRLIHLEKLEGDIVWLRYEVVRSEVRQP